MTVHIRRLGFATARSTAYRGAGATAGADFRAPEASCDPRAIDFQECLVSYHAELGRRAQHLSGLMD